MIEPENRSLVLFEHQVDMEVWFRDDECARESFGPDGDDDARWFKCGDYDGDPLCWESVVRTDPDREPVLLVRA